MKHQPINYNTWNFDGSGSNLKGLINLKEEKIWGVALPLLDKRDDLGHTEIVTLFALKLIGFFPNVNRGVVVPAAILHDIGWSKMTDTELKLFYITDDDGEGKEIWRRYEPVLRARHQELGADLARKILRENKFTKEDLTHICKIIFEHDTRKGFYSPEDGIVRSADKLYRFTYPHLGQAIRNRKTWTIKKLDELMDTWMNEEGYFWNDEIRKIARIEKQNSLRYYKQHPIIKH